MTWIIKVLNRDYQKVNKVWNGISFDDTVLGTADFIINDFKFSQSTWREVEYTLVESEDFINRQQISSTFNMTTNSKRYQFLEPLIEEVEVILPSIPIYNQRYLIKNLSEINNKLIVKGSSTGDILFTLDSTDEVATLFHDGIDFHCQI